jgi:Na+/proline symporter
VLPRDGTARAVAVAALVGFALIHLLDLPGTIADTPYVGWMYIGLIVTALVLAGALVMSSHTRIWLAAVGLVTSTMVGYVLTRTTGLPQSTDDIGNWGQPLGIAMLFLGGSFLALCGGVLISRRTAGRAPAANMRKHR